MDYFKKKFWGWTISMGLSLMVGVHIWLVFQNISSQRGILDLMVEGMLFGWIPFLMYLGLSYFYYKCLIRLGEVTQCQQ